MFVIDTINKMKIGSLSNKINLIILLTVYLHKAVSLWLLLKKIIKVTYFPFISGHVEEEAID